MTEAKAREGLKFKPNYAFIIIIPITYIGPNNPPATFDGSNIPMILLMDSPLQYYEPGKINNI